MEHWQLTVSTDGRSLVRDDGSPFFWLGDTAWDLFVCLDRDDVHEYLRNRSEKGFTVIQAVAVMGYHIPFNSANVYGKRPFEDGDPLRPDLRDRDNYWTYVDFVIDTAAHYGLYIGLLPTWGAFVCEQDPLFTQETLTSYMSWIANRYKDRPNIIWVNGGDADLKFHAGVDVPVWNAAGRALRENDPNHLADGNTLSFCHAWGGAAAYLLPRCVLGIQAAAPGFSKVRIWPQLGSLEYAKGRVPTPRGPITVEVEKRQSGLSGKVTVPEGVDVVDVPPGF